MRFLGKPICLVPRLQTLDGALVLRIHLLHQLVVRLLICTLESLQPILTSPGDLDILIWGCSDQSSFHTLELTALGRDLELGKFDRATPVRIVITGPLSTGGLLR